MFISLRAAYGRKYDTMQAMHDDWLAGKDFVIFPWGIYCSIRDIGMMCRQYPGHDIVLVNTRSREARIVARGI